MARRTWLPKKRAIGRQNSFGQKSNARVSGFTCIRPEARCAGGNPCLRTDRSLLIVQPDPLILALLARHRPPQDVHYQWWTSSRHSITPSERGHRTDTDNKAQTLVNGGERVNAPGPDRTFAKETRRYAAFTRPAIRCPEQHFCRPIDETLRRSCWSDTDTLC